MATQEEDLIKSLPNFPGVWIEIERCIDCADHAYCTRHVEERYFQREMEVQGIVESNAEARDLTWRLAINPGPGAHRANCKKITYNPYLYAAYAQNPNTQKWYQTQIFRYPRIGAFEVYVNKGRVRKQVFSKLAAGKWPNAQWLWDRIDDTVKTLNGAWDPVQVEAKPKQKHSGAGGKQEITDEELRKIIKKKFSTLIAAFRSFDRNGDGSVNLAPKWAYG